VSCADRASRFSRWYPNRLQALSVKVVLVGRTLVAVLIRRVLHPKGWAVRHTGFGFPIENRFGGIDVRTGRAAIVAVHIHFGAQKFNR